MKKILIITLMVICMIFNITACGVKSNNTSKSPLRQTKVAKYQLRDIQKI